MGNKSEKKTKKTSIQPESPIGVCVFYPGKRFCAWGSWYQGSERGWALRCSQRSPFLTLFLRVGWDAQGGGWRMPGAWGGWVCGSCWLLVDGWWLGSKKGQFFLETRHFLGGCKAAKFHLIYAVTFKCIHKEIHGLESTTQYGSQN